ncbi:hypothetical protein A4X09_0g4138 [Tilletia walkeri]|uniref:Uncharacterized protein n=1 Tax=Tilletia walkeri TaxID=117179 RepID=A0A8X7N7P2_9BASI|nr:hypothetical protein A4X09_0g4138 [Tilletia walkeri]
MWRRPRGATSTPYPTCPNAQTVTSAILVDDASEDEDEHSTDEKEGDIDPIVWESKWREVVIMVRHLEMKGTPYVPKWTNKHRVRIANAFRECAAIFDPK